jgi:hypothetical protein
MVSISITLPAPEAQALVVTVGRSDSPNQIGKPLIVAAATHPAATFSAYFAKSGGGVKNECIPKNLT